MQGSPLEQFAVYSISFLGYSVPLIFTNFLFFALIVLTAAVILFAYGSFNYKIVPDRWAGFVENYYLYIYNLIKENSGVRAQIFFPFLSTVFFFILISNVLGMFPFGYALTSQVLITFLFSCSIFLGTIFLGLRRHGINFFSLFFPSGSPAYMAFLLVPIELLSFIARPFSLGIRLFANMLAGHVLLKILSTFILIGVFAAQGLDFSENFLFFKESWISEKLGEGQLTDSGQTYVGEDKPGLVELTRIYSQPIIFDFSDAVEGAAQGYNKGKVDFDFTAPIDTANKVSPVDEAVRIGKNILKWKWTFPLNYPSDLENVAEKKECFVPHINSPEFQKCLGELFKKGPQFSEIPCTSDGPSSSFWRWFLYGAFEIKKPIEFSSIDDPNLWRYLDTMFKCPPSKGTCFFESFLKVPPKPMRQPEHFPFIYSLPHSSKGFLFSFSVAFVAALNFLISPALLVAKALVILVQIGLLLAFVILELGIAFLQAYVFIILTTIYINDSLQLH